MELQRTPWRKFFPAFARNWEQGEHVFISAKTGSGKTDLIQELMQRHKYAAFFCTKPDDPIMDDPRMGKFRITDKWNPTSIDRKLMLMPSDKDRDTPEVKQEQRIRFMEAMDKIYRSRGWAVALDELLWLSKILRLDDRIEPLAFMGRAKGITLIAATQRPYWIPAIVPQSASYAFVGRAMRDSDLKALAELGAEDNKEMLQGMRQVRGKHDFLFVDTTGKMPLQIVNTHE